MLWEISKNCITLFKEKVLLIYQPISNLISKISLSFSVLTILPILTAMILESYLANSVEQVITERGPFLQIITQKSDWCQGGL